MRSSTEGLSLLTHAHVSVRKDGNVESSIFLELQRLERLLSTVNSKLGAEPGGEGNGQECGAHGEGAAILEKSPDDSCRVIKTAEVRTSRSTYT